MSQDQDIKALHEINKRLLKDPNESLPAVTLADGTKIQTGTVGPLIQNIKLYDRVCAGEVVEGGLTKELLEEMMTTPIQTLKKSGLLDIFPPDEWIAGGTSSGRKFVGQKAKEMGYQIPSIFRRSNESGLIYSPAFLPPSALKLLDELKDQLHAS